jgi:hypothetical protein
LVISFIIKTERDTGMKGTVVGWILFETMGAGKPF